MFNLDLFFTMLFLEMVQYVIRRCRVKGAVITLYWAESDGKHQIKVSSHMAKIRKKSLTYLYSQMLSRTNWYISLTYLYSVDFSFELKVC